MMQRIIICLFVSLILTACAVDRGGQEISTSIISIAATPGSTSTNTAVPLPTQTQVPTKSPTPTLAETATLEPTPSPTPLPAFTPSQTPTPRPTATIPLTPTPEVSQSDNLSPAIRYFRVNKIDADTGNVTVIEERQGSLVSYTRVNADPGDTLVFEWDTVRGVASLSGEGDVDATGTITYVVESDWPKVNLFMLKVVDEADWFGSGFEVTLLCDHSPFYSSAPPSYAMGNSMNDGCPRPPVVSDAVEQRFERGFMIWVKETDEIIAVNQEPPGIEKYSYLPHTHMTRPNEWNEGDPDHDPTLTPPPGLYQPVRGFGQMWRTNPEVREGLGWAVTPETYFKTTYQSFPTGGRNWSFEIETYSGDILRLSFGVGGRFSGYASYICAESGKWKWSDERCDKPDSSGSE